MTKSWIGIMALALVLVLDPAAKAQGDDAASKLPGMQFSREWGAGPDGVQRRFSVSTIVGIEGSTLRVRTHNYSNYTNSENDEDFVYEIIIPLDKVEFSVMDGNTLKFACHDASGCIERKLGQYKKGGANPGNTSVHTFTRIDRPDLIPTIYAALCPLTWCQG
jgi:hypothetical protein